MSRRDVFDGLTRLAAAPLLVAALSLPALAQVERLDDSASPRAEVRVDLQRATPLDGQRLRVPFGRVEYRLATHAYVGQRARIFYVVPPHIAGVAAPSGLTVLWGGGAWVAPGEAQPGMRVPVWQGVVPGPWMQDAIELALVMDMRALRLPGGAPLSFESFFEIEVLP